MDYRMALIAMTLTEVVRRFYCLKHV